MSDLSDDYEYSDEDAEIDLIDDDTGEEYSLSVYISHIKRLICYSVVNGKPCKYGSKCTYAHSIDEQVIDEDKMELYRTVLTHMSNVKFDDLMYRKIENLGYICNACRKGRCTGGYNCRNGVFDMSLKICKNDFLTGTCSNELIKIEINPKIWAKIMEDQPETPSKVDFIGCCNGHHLTLRGVTPYYRYLQEQSNPRDTDHLVRKRTEPTFQSIRYIDNYKSKGSGANIPSKSSENVFVDSYGNIMFSDTGGSNIINLDESLDSTTDEDIDNCFKDESSSE